MIQFDFICRKCNSSSYFFKRSGMQVGMYCANCGSWAKWMGKKDVAVLKNQNVKIFDQNADISLGQDSDLGFEPENVINIGVQNVKNSNQNFNAVNQNYGVSKEVKNLNDLQTNQEAVRAKSEPCDMCSGKSFSVLNMSEKVLDMSRFKNVRVSILDGAFSAVFEDDKSPFCLFKVNYCPNCGRKIN